MTETAVKSSLFFV